MLNVLSKKLSRNSNKGFSLVELLVVVAILAILAAIAIPLFLNQRQKAYEGTAQSDGRNLATDVTSVLSDRVSWTSNSTTTTNAVNAWTASSITEIGDVTTGGIPGSLSPGSSITVVKTPTTSTWCFTISNNGETASYNQSGLMSGAC